MRVAVDEQIFAIQSYGGISRLFAELIRQYVSDPELGVDLDPVQAPIVNRYILDDPFLVTRLRVTSARNQWTALAWYFSHLERRRTDVVHTTFYLPHGLSSARGTKRVVTVYDMIPERLPETRRRLDLLTFKRRYIEAADHVICISQATKDDLLDLYGLRDIPMTVVHLGVDSRFNPNVQRIPDFPEQYVLFVGHRGQYKDASTLMRAFAEIHMDFPKLHLVFAGGGSLMREERAMLKELGIDQVTRQFDLPDGTMPSAYAHASAFAFPSRFEGFGLPVLEAMACGTPTTLARSTSLPEVGGDAALYFDPGNHRQLAEQLSGILDSHWEATRMSTAGIERARNFTWNRTALETSDVYRQVLS